MKSLLRVPIHALFICGIMHLSDAFVQDKPVVGFQLVFSLIRPAGFLLFSLALASGLNNQRGPVVLILILLLLALFPISLSDLEVHLVPVGLGLLIGLIIRGFVSEHREA